MAMINPNNLNQLASSLADVLEKIISPNDLEKLSEKQRAYLTVLINQWSQGKDVLGIINSILGVKPIQSSTYQPKTEWYLKNKLK